MLKGVLEKRRVEPMTPLPGLEESRGALYEIGVSDDGTFVGLVEDELDESLETLGIMAASLGCTVTVVRKVVVGECEWEEQSKDAAPTAIRGQLWVAEAYVRPNTISPSAALSTPAVIDGADESHAPAVDYSAQIGGGAKAEGSLVPQAQLLAPTHELRVTLTGSTMSGKSSLLGTLTTNTLDNGRGKSRLSLLKHQHEIATGMTSSVTHELLGYRPPEHAGGNVQVVNFATGNISSWIDIHASCAGGGRLVFFSDSAGHPRYRRTTVRGLVGWRPHWTLLCLPADNLEDTAGLAGSTPPAHETLGLPDAVLDVDLSLEHLDLCLKLELPLVVVITKSDLPSRAGLRTYLNRVLTALKRAGRQPFIIPDVSRDLSQTGFSRISGAELTGFRPHVRCLEEDPSRYTPILLTSAVRGVGIKALHALLHELPIPRARQGTSSERPVAIFDIEDVYGSHSSAQDQVPVLSGTVRRGQISIGDELYLGPFAKGRRPTHIDDAVPIGTTPSIAGSFPPLFQSAPETGEDAASATAFHLDDEWVRVRVASARHLRLSTRSLCGGQVGTIGVSVVDVVRSHATTTGADTIMSGGADVAVERLEPDQNQQHARAMRLSSTRKGMVLAATADLEQLPSRRSLVAEFARRDVDPLSIGSSVVLYFNSVRVSARIVAGAIIDGGDDGYASLDEHDDDDDDDDLAFQFDDTDSRRTSAQSRKDDERLRVTFQFIPTREYVEMGTKVLVMPDGGPAVVYGGFSRGEKGVAGLSGFVGHVVDPQD
jgi:GTPase